MRTLRCFTTLFFLAISFLGFTQTITIDSPVELDDIVNASEATTVTVSGTSAGGAVDMTIVRVTIGGVTEDATISGADGPWTVDLDISGEANGPLTIAAVYDPGGANTTATNNDYPITLDQAQPSISGVTTNLSTISDSDAGLGSFYIEVAFNEAMIDDGSQDPSITFDNGAENPATTLSLPVNTWPDNQTFRITYTAVDANVDLADIDVLVAGGQDVAGNGITATNTDQNNLFSIDTDNPSITGVTTNVATVSDSEAGVGGFYIEVAFDEPMIDNGTQDPSITFDNVAENPATTLGTPVNSWPNNQTFRVAYTVTDADVDLANIDVLIAGGQDLLGNGITATNTDQNDLFDIDTENPSLTLVSFNPSNVVLGVGDALTVSVTEGGGDVGLTANATTVNGVDVSASLSHAGGGVYDFTYTVGTLHTDRAAGTIPVSFVLNDAAGNASNTITTVAVNTTGVDATEPSISGVTTNVATISDSDAGVGGFYIEVAFDEPMIDNGTQDPSITFDNVAENPATTLGTPVNSWPNNQTFRVAYTVTDANVDLADIDVLVAGGQDLAGNGITATNTDQNDLFSIDTDNPSITGVTTNIATISDSDAGVGGFYIEVAFDEPMIDNGTQDPSITFDNGAENPATTLGTPVNSWPNNQTFRVAYTVTDANVDLANIDVLIAGGQDLAGTGITATNTDQNDLFDIDTENPTFVDATYYDVNRDGTVDEILLEFSEDINELSVSDADFNIGSTGLGSTSFTVFNAGFPAGNGVDASLTDNFITLQVSITGTSDQTIDYTAGGLSDEFGNIAATAGGITTIDLAAPVIIAAATDDTGGNGEIDEISVTFSEDIDALTLDTDGGSDDFIVTDGAYTYTVTSVAFNAPNGATITLTERGTPDTGVTPDINLGIGDIEDLAAANNSLTVAQDFTSTTDGAFPVIVDQLINSSNAYFQLVFSEEIFAVDGAINPADFDITINNGAATVTVTNVIDLLGTSPIASEDTIRFSLNVTPNALSPDGSENITVSTNGTTIDDAADNLLANSETSATVNLNVNTDQVTVTGATYTVLGADDGYIEFTFSEGLLSGDAGTARLANSTGGVMERNNWTNGSADTPLTDDVNFQYAQNGSSAQIDDAQDNDIEWTDNTGTIIDYPSSYTGTVFRLYLNDINNGPFEGVETYTLSAVDGRISGRSTGGPMLASYSFVFTLPDQVAEDFTSATATAYDVDADGNIDEVEVVMPDGIEDATVTPSDFQFNSIAASGFDTGTTPNDNTFRLLFDSYPGTAVVGNLVYTAGTMEDDAEVNAPYLSSGNAVNSGSITPTDAAGPVILSATTADNDLNGRIDEITVTFSEAFSDIGIDDTDFSLSGGYTIPGAGFAVASPNVTLTLNEMGAADTDQVPDVSVDVADILRDLSVGTAPNPIQTFTNTSDGAAPYIQVNSSSGNATPDFSGTIDDPTATVIISVDGQTRSSAPAIQNNGDGTWSYTSSSDGAPITLGAGLGFYEVTVIGIDNSGNNRTDVTSLEYELTGGANITPASPATLCESDDFQALGQIVIDESGNGDFSAGTDVTLLLTLPAGFEFDPSTAANFGASSLSDISAISSIFVGTASLQITMTVTGTAGDDIVRIDNLQVKVVNGGASGNLVRAGGTASLLTNDTNYATLSSNAAPADLTDLRDASDPGTPLTSLTARFLPRVTVTYTAGPVFTNGEDFVFASGATGTMVAGTLTPTTFDMYLTSGTVDDTESFTGQTSGQAGTTAAAAAGVSDVLLPFTLNANPTATANWYNGAGGLINSLASNNNTALSATTPGLYTYDVTDDNATCESNPLRFNVHVYDDVHPDNDESTFVTKTYILTDDRDTIYMSNPAGHTVTITGNGISVVGGGAGGSDPLLAIFDPFIAGTNGGLPQAHTITYTITNTTTMESTSEVVTFTVEPETEIYVGPPSKDYCVSDGTITVEMDNTGFNLPASLTNPYIQYIDAFAQRFGGLNVNYNGPQVQAGNFSGTTTPYEIDIDLASLGVPAGNFESIRFSRVVIDALGVKRVDAINYFLIYANPAVTLTNVAATYCEDDSPFTLNRTISYVQSVDASDPANPIATFGGETNQAITNGYELYRFNGVTYVPYQNFTSTGPFGIVNDFDPTDPNQNGTADANDVGQFRITYYTEALTPNSCVGQRDVFVTVNPDTPTPTLNAATETGGGSTGTILNGSPAAGVDGNEYLLEYCVGDVVAGFTTDDVNTVRWYDDGLNLIPAFNGMTTITPAAVGLSLNAALAFNAEQTVDFYFTSTDGTGCESDYRLVRVSVYAIPDIPSPDITGWPAAAQPNDNLTYFDYCIPQGGSVVPDDITFAALNPGERYNINWTLYLDQSLSPRTNGFIYELNVSGVSGSFNYGDNVSVPHTTGTAVGFVYSYAGSRMLLALNGPSFTFAGPVTVTNTTDAVSTATLNTAFGSYTLPSNVIDVPPLSGAGTVTYFRYNLSKTSNVNGSSNFDGCTSASVNVFAFGWKAPTDPTIADLQAGVTTFHVSEGETLSDITHTSVGMNGYVWYENSNKTGIIGTDTLLSLASMTNATLTTETSFDPSTVGVQYTNDTYTYYFSRIDQAVTSREFDGCESAGTLPVNIVVHSIQRQPVIASDNSASSINTTPFTDLNFGGITDPAVDYFYSICTDRLEAVNELDATEPMYGGASRTFRWYDYNIGTGMRGTEFTTDGSGTATLAELQLTALSGISTTTNRYFEVVQITDNDVYGGVESESTLIRVQVSPQDALEFRDNATGLTFDSEFCRDDALGSIVVDLYSGGSSAGGANVDYEIDSYTATNYNLSILRTATIAHTVSTAYTVGETVVGVTSGATAEVVTDDGSTMTVQNISGTFQVGETINGSSSGIMSTSNTVTDTTPGPDVDGGIIAGNPTLNFTALHDAVPGTRAVGGEATVHVIMMRFTDPTTLCEASASKVVTIYPDPHISIRVRRADELRGVDINDVNFSNEFCYENVSVSLTGVQYIYDNTGIIDTVSLNGGTFTSSISGAIGSGGVGSFNPLDEHNAFHTVTLTDGEFLNQSDIDITFSYTDTDGTTCDNTVMTTLLVNPLPEALPVTGLPTSDLAEGNASNDIRVTNSCVGSGVVTAEIKIVDPADPDPGSVEESLLDYGSYTFTWTVDGSTVTDLNLDGLPNTIEFAPPSNFLTIEVVVQDLNGCLKTYTEDHDLQDLPSLDITGIVNDESFCADDIDPVIGLADFTENGDNATHTVVVGDIVSWSVDSYNQADGVGAIAQIASGAGTLPVVDLDAWHTSGMLATPGTLVGGNSTFHRITIVYQDPSRAYQGVSTGCSNTVIETIVVNPDPDISITLNGVDMDDIEFCHDDVNISLQGIDLGTGLALNGGTFNQIRIDGTPVSSNGSATINASAYHAATPGIVSPGDEFLPQSRHTIEYEYEDENSCRRTITRDFLINPRPRFVGDVIQTASTCATGFVELFVDMTDGASNYSFTWFVNGQEVNGTDAIDRDGNNNDERITYDFGGQLSANFSVTATYTGPGFSTNCIASIPSQQITVGAEPIPAITWVGTTAGNPSGTDFTITEDNATLPDGDVNLVELEIDGMSELLIVDDPMTGGNEVMFPIAFNHNFTTPGTHTVSVTMNTTAGCAVTLTRNVRVLPHFSTFNAANSYSESFETAASFDLTAAQGGWLIDSLSLDGKIYYDTATSWVRGASIPGTASEIDGTGAVYTAPGGSNGYRESEVSFVYSPSFDLSGFTAPTVSFLRYEDFETFRDGAVFQVSVDDGRTWQTVGTYNPALAAVGLASTPGWYNREAISSSPGSVAPGSATASNTAQVGWALNSDWQEAVSPIEINPAQDDYVRFRFALSAQAGTKTTNGFGFDLVRIYERNQIVLIETFSSTLDENSKVLNDTVDVRPQYAGTDILKINYFTDIANGSVIDQINERNVTDPGAKVAFYGVGDVPSIAISGDANTLQKVEVANGQFELVASEFSLLNAKLANARLNNPAFDISVTASVDTDGNLVVNAGYTATTAFGALQEVTLMVAVVEPTVVTPTALSDYYPAGTSIQNVLRTLLPSAAGQYEPGPIAIGETRSLTNLTWPISNMYDPSTVRVIAYVQDLNTKQVYQASSLDVATGLSNSVLGLEDLSDFKVYPNPADREVTIEFADGLSEDKQWIIFDQAGREVLKGEIERGTQTLTVETSDLPSGLYFINLYGEDKERVTKRVMVLH